MQFRGLNGRTYGSTRVKSGDTAVFNAERGTIAFERSRRKGGAETLYSTTGYSNFFVREQPEKLAELLSNVLNLTAEHVNSTGDRTVYKFV